MYQVVYVLNALLLELCYCYEGQRRSQYHYMIYHYPLRARCPGSPTGGSVNLSHIAATYMVLAQLALIGSELHVCPKTHDLPQPFAKTKK